MERARDRLEMSREVELLADRADSSGQGHRAAELRDVAAHLRAKADAPPSRPRRQARLDRRNRLLLAVGVVLPLVCLAVVLLVAA